MKNEIQKSIDDIFATPLSDLKVAKDDRHYFRGRGKYTRVTKVIDVLDKKALNKYRENLILKMVREILNEAVSAGKKITEAFIDDLVFRAGNEADRIMREAAGVGNQIHSVINGIYKGEIYNLELFSRKIYCGVNSAIKFQKDTGFKTISSEETLFCEKLLIAGTPDRVGMLDDALTVLDYKSGKSIWKTGQLQTATYRYLWFVKTGEWAKKTIVIHLSTTKIDYRIYWQDLTKLEIEDNWKTYLHLLSALRWVEK